MKWFLETFLNWFLRFALDPNPLAHEDHDITRNMR
jgi:hypothetical protein